MSYKFLANLIIKGKIRCETGLHIGGMVEGYEIGGMDNPVIKDPITGYPYIPGSSLRGKMRSLLEWAKGLVNNDGDVHVCNNQGCPVCRSFGVPAEEGRAIGPTRLIVRDAWPTEETKKNLDTLQREKGLPKVEWKSENVINRITSEATPRQIERVPKGSEFDFELVYGIYDVSDKGEKDIEHLKYVFEAIELLEDSTLGGYGSRGSGKISIKIEEMRLKKLEDYENNEDGEKIEEKDREKIIKEKLSVSKSCDKNENNLSKT